MSDESLAQRLGPVTLASGYSVWNARSYLLAAMITVGMLAFISFIQPYLLNANLNVPSDEQGRVLGLLGFSNELLSLLLVARQDRASTCLYVGISLARRRIFLVSIGENGAATSSLLTVLRRWRRSRWLHDGDRPR
jgi:hypothetical protein